MMAVVLEPTVLPATTAVAAVRHGFTNVSAVHAAAGGVSCAAAATAATSRYVPMACVAGIGEIKGVLGEGVLVLRLRQPIRPPGDGDHPIGEPDPVRLGDRSGPAVFATKPRQHHQRRSIGERRGGLFDRPPSRINHQTPIERRQPVRLESGGCGGRSRPRPPESRRSDSSCERRRRASIGRDCPWAHTRLTRRAACPDAATGWPGDLAVYRIGRREVGLAGGEAVALENMRDRSAACSDVNWALASAPGGMA